MCHISSHYSMYNVIVIYDVLNFVGYYVDFFKLFSILVITVCICIWHILLDGSSDFNMGRLSSLSLFRQVHPGEGNSDLKPGKWCHQGQGRPIVRLPCIWVMSYEGNFQFRRLNYFTIFVWAHLIWVIVTSLTLLTVHAVWVAQLAVVTQQKPYPGTRKNLIFWKLGLKVLHTESWVASGLLEQLHFWSRNCRRGTSS